MTYLNKDEMMHLKKLYYDATSVFEFGVGELTTTVVPRAKNLLRYAGVDSNAELLSNVRNKTTIQQEHNDHFRFFFADIGQTTESDKTMQNELKKAQYQYTVAPLGLELQAFDLYVIDGRQYYLQCVCVAFFHAIKYGANMDKIRVVVHGERYSNRAMSGIDNQRLQIEDITDILLLSPSLQVHRLVPSSENIRNLYKLWQQLQ